MSTILEALKKSEQERKQNHVPTLADKPPPPERSRWPWIVVSIALVCMAGALVYLFVRLPGAAPTSATSATTGAQTSTSLTTASGQANAGGSGSAQAPVSDWRDAKLEVISWSPEVEKRFAMINGKLFRVGDYLQAGVLIEEIKQDSVTVNHRGKLTELKP